ncbi:MAG: DUF4465 domain-containing protein [Alistipes sp.]|nr:DUF4465 domain-containing protein [Alistipes sp.]
MKKLYFILILTLCGISFTSCEYDDNELWNKVNSLEEQVKENANDIATLSKLVDALNTGKHITQVLPTDNGYILSLSDGSSIEIDNKSFFESVEIADGMVIITLADGRVVKIPLLNYELKVLTFEDSDYKGEGEIVAGVEINCWSDLIDDAQYGGSMLYGDQNYYWWDENHTDLYSELNDGGPYWNGGHAISNYFMADYSTADYTTQLAVSCGSEGAAGNNGSANFVVHNGYVDASSYKTTMASFSFRDNQERVIDHIYITNTSYFLRSVELGDGFNTPITDDSWVKVTAYGYDATGQQTGSTDFYLVAKGKKIIKEWTKWDLSKLGEVEKIAFNISASEDQYGEWGLNCPAYFAYDDVAVRVKTE